MTEPAVLTYMSRLLQPADGSFERQVLGDVERSVLLAADGSMVQVGVLLWRDGANYRVPITKIGTSRAKATRKQPSTSRKHT